MDDLWKKIENINISSDAQVDNLIQVIDRLIVQEKTKCENNSQLLKQLGLDINNLDDTSKKYVEELTVLVNDLGSTSFDKKNLTLRYVSKKADELEDRRNRRKLERDIKLFSKYLDDTKSLEANLRRDYEKLSQEINNSEDYTLMNRKYLKKIEQNLAVLSKMEEEYSNLDTPEKDIEKYKNEFKELEALQEEHFRLNEELAKFYGASTDVNILEQQIIDKEKELKKYENHINL